MPSIDSNLQTIHIFFSIYALNCFSKRRKYNTKAPNKEAEMKNPEKTKKDRRFCRRFLYLLGAAIIIWIVYSWIVVSGYKLLELVPGEVAPDYIEFRGAAHIHTNYSHDGHGEIDEVLSIAREIGLDFIVISDHNNMGSWELSRKRTTERPILLVGNELSTDAGHLLGYGLHSRRDSYPDGHQAAIDEVHKDGGIAVIAHPTRRKTSWKDIYAEGIDGMEVMNFEDFIFSAPKMKILLMLPQAFIDQRAAFASLIEYPTASIKLWDDMGREKKVIGFGGTDAHGPLAFGIPAYRHLLGTVNIHIVARKLPDFNLTGELIEKSLKNGNFYLSVDCIAVSRHIDFRLQRTDNTSLLIGEGTSSIKQGYSLVFNASLPAGSITNLIRNGKMIEQFSGKHFTYPVIEPGAYRVEVIIPERNNPYGSDKLWAITNHIYIGQKTNIKEQSK
jgi:hypothetical protein